MAFRSLVRIFDLAAPGDGIRILPRDCLQPVANDGRIDQARVTVTV